MKKYIEITCLVISLILFAVISASIFCLMWFCINYNSLGIAISITIFTISLLSLLAFNNYICILYQKYMEEKEKWKIQERFKENEKDL